MRLRMCLSEKEKEAKRKRVECDLYSLLISVFNYSWRTIIIIDLYFYKSTLLSLLYRIDSLTRYIIIPLWIESILLYQLTLYIYSI